MTTQIGGHVDLVTQLPGDAEAAGRLRLAVEHEQAHVGLVDDRMHSP